MEEKIYTTKRKGMAVLLTVLFVYLIAITGTVFGAVKYEDSAETGYLVLMVVSIVVFTWMVSTDWTSGVEATGSIGFDVVREVCWYNPGSWFLLRESILYSHQSGSCYKAGTEWGYPADSSEECIFHLCGWYICIGRWFYIRKEDFIKGDDTEQWQTEDQRLSR